MRSFHRFEAFVIGVVLAVLTGCGAFAVPTRAESAPLAEQSVAQKIESSLVSVKGIKVLDGMTYDAWCAGVVIAPRLVVVNAHSVLEASGDVEGRFLVVLPNGDKLLTKPLAVDDANDLALLQPIDAEAQFAAPAATLASTLPAINEEVRMLARLSGFRQSTVQDVVSVFGETSMIGASFVTRKGDSGSPVYTLDGAVVGIHAIGKGVSGTRTYAVPATAIRAFVRTAAPDVVLQ